MWLAHITIVLGVLKATLSLHDLLEGLKELGKAGILMVMACYSERLQIKFSKGKRLGETRQSF